MSVLLVDKVKWGLRKLTAGFSNVEGVTYLNKIIQ